MFRQTPEPSGEAPVAPGSVVVQPDTVHPEEYAVGDVPGSPDVRGHATHVPFASFVNPGRHVIRQAPELSGEALNAPGSVVVQPDTVHPEEYAVGDVPGSPCITVHTSQLLVVEFL